jgi:CBS domain-containing protein
MGPAIAVAEDTSLREIATLMVARHVEGVLVVNAQAEVVGLVTARQLTLDGHYLRLACAEVPEIGGRWVTALEEFDAACTAARTLIARDVMERRLTSACADEPVAAAVERMVRREAECAVVHQGGSVVGMLGSHDLLRKVAGEPIVARAPADTLCVNGQPVHLGGKRQVWPPATWLVGLWK